MKKSLLYLFALVAAQLSVRADLLFSETFDYADGALTNVSGGVWVLHSGSGTGLDVSGQKAVLSEKKGDDVNRLLPGQPYATGNLYASFTVNLSALPSGTGGYFAHFKDASTGFRARVFATVTGADPGTYRVGIANGSSASPVTVPLNLSLDTTYTLVLRYECAAAKATLWISPTSEDSLVNRADADTFTVLSIAGFALRQSLSSNNGMGILTLDDLKVGTTFSDVAVAGDPTKNPPIVSAIGNQSIPANGSTPAISFTVNDGETAPADLTVAAASGNETLVPNANIVLGGSGTARTITVTPAAAQQGTATITVSVTDSDGNTANSSFDVVVGAPTISAVANQITPVNTPSQPIAFTVGDAESAPGSLTLSFWSSNPTLLPAGSVAFGGGDANRTAVITPASGQAGVAMVSFIVSDGSSTATNRFVLTVAKSIGLDLDEAFAYDDGPVVDASFGIWARYSGGTNEALVTSGQLLISQTNTEDIHHFVGWGVPVTFNYNTNGGYVIYYSFQVSSLQLPAGANGDYFTFLKDDGTSNFRARVYVTTNGAAAGHYRLALANGAATPSVVLATDLTLGNSYTVMVRYNVATAESVLWLNPASESSPSVAATDTTSPINISTVAFRENRSTNSSGEVTQGMGTLLIDNAKQATAWSDAYQTPNWPPTISPIADQTTALNTATPAIPFAVGDTEPGALLLAVASTNTDLVPVSNIALSGSDMAWTVKITPANGQSGTTLVTITVRDSAGQMASTSFLVTVLGLNLPPTISTIPNQTIVLGATLPPIQFTVSDAETPASSLIVAASSSNPTLVPDANLVLGGSDANRTLTITPVAGQTGVSTITVGVSDGLNVTSTNFDFTVSQEILLRETFDYADGPITTNSGFIWKTHSGTAGQAQISSGKLLLNSTNTEDISVIPTNAPFLPAGNAVLYAGFTLQFTEAPGGDYFAHFKDMGNNFRAKVTATLNNAAAGYFRLGIANAANGLGSTNPPFPLDLTTGVTYRVVLRYQVGKPLSTLWINPTNETDTSVTATDTGSTIVVTNFAFRESSNIGKLWVDDLIIGTTFDSVKSGSPAPPKLSIAATPGYIVISWPATSQGFELQSCPDIIAREWQKVDVAPETNNGWNVVTLPAPSSGNRFYRLVK